MIFDCFSFLETGVALNTYSGSLLWVLGEFMWCQRWNLGWPLQVNTPIQCSISPASCIKILTRNFLTISLFHFHITESIFRSLYPPLPCLDQQKERLRMLYFFNTKCLKALVHIKINNMECDKF